MLAVLLLLWTPTGGAGAPISCYNDRGEAVDWFYLYKLPKGAAGSAAGGRHGDPGSRGEGLNYLLLERGGEDWLEGKVTMNDSRSAAGRTLAPLYSPGKNAQQAFILYNDQPPGDGVGHGGGHTKGVVLLDGDRGFWLVHSTPHFPPPPPSGRYSYPHSGVNNGQSFLCVTFSTRSFQSVGEQLQINQPHVYDCDVPESLAAAAPALADVCRGRPGAARNPRRPGPPTNRSAVLTSADGAEFTSFAKGASFNDDLYHSWVAPTLRSDLLVQFWVRSTGVLPSDCSRGRRVLDVLVLRPGRTSKFKTSQDHSKWAVSPGPGGGAGGGGWVCVGDINRNKAEERRGGGTVCQRNPAVWRAYRAAALECDDCGGTSTSCPSS